MPALTASTRRRIASRFHVLRQHREPQLAYHVQAFLNAQGQRVRSRFMVHQSRKIGDVLGVPYPSRLFRLRLRFEVKQGEGTPTENDLLPHSEDDALQRVLLPELVAHWQTTGNLASDLVGAPSPLPSDLALLRYIQQAGVRIVGIDDTTRQAIRDLLARAASVGASPYQIAYGVPPDRVSDWMAGQGFPREGLPGLSDVVAQTYRGRAEMISRTELAWSALNASISRYDAAGVQQVQIEDGGLETSCDECNARDGEVYDIDEAPDLQHPACTMVLIPLVGGEDGEGR